MGKSFCILFQNQCCMDQGKNSHAFIHGTDTDKDVLN